MEIHADNIFQNEDQLRAFIGTPADLAVAKAIGHLDKYCLAFIQRSPFVLVGTASKDGKNDVSPRGDAAGFAHVIDENTLFIPERPGNKRVDTLSNLIENPSVGLLFLVPGFDDCLRVNGKAKVIKDQRLLEQCAVNKKIPQLGILIEVEGAMLHCAKAIRRSKLWEPESQHDRKQLPSIGKMILEQTSDGRQIEPETIVEVDTWVEDDYKNKLY